LKDVANNKVANTFQVYLITTGTPENQYRVYKKTEQI
jgi:hypothetical protein